MMLRLILAGVVVWSCLVFGAIGQTLTLLGVGPGARVVACTPVTLPGGAIFQDAGLTNGGWSAQQATLTTNQVASPACAITGAKLTEDATASTTHQAFFSVSTTTASTPYTLSVYANRQAGTRNLFLQALSSAFTSNAGIGADLGGCTINIAAAVSGTFTAPGGSVSGPFVFNGASWCKVTLTWTGIVDTAIDLLPLMMSGTSTSYNGDGTSAIGLWGVDLR